MTGDELKIWRNAAGLTQTELAGWMGCSLRTVQEMEKSADHLRTDQQLALDFASMNIALDRRDAGKLTMTALKTWLALEGWITPADRARVDFDGVFVMSQHENDLVESWARAMGRPPAPEAVRSFILNVRAKTAERSATADT